MSILKFTICKLSFENQKQAKVSQLKTLGWKYNKGKMPKTVCVLNIPKRKCRQKLTLSEIIIYTYINEIWGGKHSV